LFFGWCWCIVGLMNQAVLVIVLQMLLGFFQTVAYALLVLWAFRLLKSLPLENYLPNIRFYHLLVPALALAGLAIGPVKYLLELLFSFPLDFSQAWIPPLLTFLQGLGFLGLLVYLCFSFRRALQPWVWVAVLVVILAVLGGGYYYLCSQGYIAGFPFSKPEYLDYQNESPRFSFSYPSKFVLDKDKENRFGETYLVGIKLASGARVGCDVRVISGQLSLEGELEEITKSLADQISQDAEGFEVLNSSLIELGGEKGIKLEVSFAGPSGETMRADQVFAAHKEKVYTLVCGAPKNTYDSFVEDFSYFLDYFAWE